MFKSNINKSGVFVATQFPNQVLEGQSGQETSDDLSRLQELCAASCRAAANFTVGVSLADCILGCTEDTVADCTDICPASDVECEAACSLLCPDEGRISLGRRPLSARPCCLPPTEICGTTATGVSKGTRAQQVAACQAACSTGTPFTDRPGYPDLTACRAACHQYPAAACEKECRCEQKGVSPTGRDYCAGPCGKICSPGSDVLTYSWSSDGGDGQQAAATTTDEKYCPVVKCSYGTLQDSRGKLVAQ